jgi:hypothetical protein
LQTKKQSEEKIMRLKITVTERDARKAKGSKCGWCPVSVGAKRTVKEEDVPWTNISTDLATIRLTNSETGERWIFPTPAYAQAFLTLYDEGKVFDSEGKLQVKLPFSFWLDTAKAVQVTKVGKGTKVERKGGPHYPKKEVKVTLQAPRPGASKQAPDRPTIKHSMLNGGRTLPILSSRNRRHGMRAFDQAITAFQPIEQPA